MITPSSNITPYHKHPLIKVHSDSEFLCDGCNTLGNYTRYRCEPCNFDLHEYCNSCAGKLSSFTHKHDLKLVVRNSKKKCRNKRICDLCCDPVEGNFYQCKKCDFYVHPPCTQLPEYVRHVLDMKHLLRLQRFKPRFSYLRLQRSKPRDCVVCGDKCNFWHYSCDACKLDIHFECVLKPCQASSPSISRSLGTNITQQKSSILPSAPYGHGRSNPQQSHNHVQQGAYGPMVQPQPYSGNNYGTPYGSTSQVQLGGHGSMVQPQSYFHYNCGVPHLAPYGHGHGSQQSHSHVQQGEGSSGTSGKVQKKMYAIAGNLVIGVASSVLFGTIFTPFG